MTLYSPYSVETLDSYERSFKKLLKKHYKKNRRGAEALAELLKEIQRGLSVAPDYAVSAVSQVKFERMPRDALPDHWWPRKLFFKCPELRGAAAEGRLLYCTNEEERRIVLIMIYTHQMYEKRPSDKELQEVLRRINGR